MIELVAFAQPLRLDLAFGRTLTGDALAAAACLAVM